MAGLRAIVMPVVLCLGLASCDGSGPGGVPRSASVPEARAGLGGWHLPLLPGGGEAHAVVQSAIAQGSLALPLDGLSAVLAELAAGHGVVVGKGGADAGLAVGYDLDHDALLMAGGDRMALHPWKEGWAQAARWAVAIMPPGEMPASAEAPNYLRAAGSLRDTGYAFEAVLAYDAGVSRWPKDPEALAGLGRCLLVLGDRQGAAQAFTAAQAVDKDAKAGQSGERATIARREGDIDAMAH
jgi:tetratricopeptide (TPR) repeat protein